MSYESLETLAKKLEKDSDIAETYVYHLTSGAVPKAPLTKSIFLFVTRVKLILEFLGEAKHYYCEARNSVSEDALKCLGLQAQVSDFLGLAAQLLPGAWDYAKC